MNLNYSSSFSQDNLVLTITDTTEDWLAGEISDVYNFGSASLTFTIGGVSYDAIDITDSFQAGTAPVILLSPSDFKVGGVQQFSVFPDADYSGVYFAETQIDDDTYSQTDYHYATVEKEVLEELGVANLNDWKFENTFREAMLVGSWYVYLVALSQAAEDGEVADFRSALDNLQVMLSNRSY